MKSESIKEQIFDLVNFLDINLPEIKHSGNKLSFGYQLRERLDKIKSEVKQLTKEILNT